MKIILNGENPQSWNAYYSGSHWSNRAEEAERVRLLVRSALPRDIPQFQKCHIKISVFFGDKRIHDVDNICAKFYIDALKAAGVMPDDNYKYVPMLTVFCAHDKGKQRVEIEVIGYE